MPDDLIKPSQAAKLLGLHINTIYRWINQSRLKSYRLGCHLRVSEAAAKACCQPEERKQPEKPGTRRQAKRLQAWANDVLKSVGVI